VRPNPVLRKLGFADNDRLVILHVDDVGMSHATLSALDDLLEFGLISSAAVMAPCPWFPQAAAYCREHPQIDMGVHLTLNSEWDGCRWGPVSTRDSASGLMDDEGFFYRHQTPVQDKADPDAARKELTTQIERALAAGIDVTHIDSHMGTIAHLKFVPIYRDLALQFRLPPTIIFRADQIGFQKLGLDDEFSAWAARTVEMLEEQGVPLLDHEFGLPLDQPEERVEQAKRALEALPAGITHFFMHPAHDTPELRAMAPDWPSRVADYEAFMSQELRDFIKNKGIHVIGNRVLRDLMR
jgi:predicted glycoside hydrolase/deacetylase ChbG (UPF0249 family)